MITVRKQITYTFPRLTFTYIHLYSHIHTAALYTYACIQLYSGPIKALDLFRTYSMFTARAVYRKNNKTCIHVCTVSFVY